MTTFGSLINDSKKDEEWTYSDEIGGRRGEKLEAIATQSNIEKEFEPNLDQVINNIQVEHVMSIELVVSIIEVIVIATKSFQLVQLEVELIQIENP
jgi:hypothetical protein